MLFINISNKVNKINIIDGPHKKQIANGTAK
jgi:hypothetical protein